MVTQKIWNLMYVAGNPGIRSKVSANASNPMKRAEALAAAERVAANGWRVWVEHSVNGTRIFESDVEKSYRAASSN
jgi:hypothetical protein